MILLYAARHDATDLNDAGKFRGPSNVPLNAEGMRGAEAQARWLAKKSIGTAFTSPKTRALQTAHAIHQQIPDLPFHVAPALQAWNVGDFAGKSKDKYEEEFENTYVANPDLQVPGGESLNQFRARIHPAIHHAVALAKRMQKPVLLVTHSSVIHEMGNMFNGNHKSALVEPGGIAGLEENSPIRAVALFKPVEEGPRLPENSLRVEYMELPGAQKDADCAKVKIRGGVSSDLGCCDRYEWDPTKPKQFRCGACEYLRPLKKKAP